MTYTHAPIDSDRWVKFGCWLERERVARRLSKTEATKLSGLSPSSWYNLSHGGRMKDGARLAHQPTTETLMAIADAFDMNYAEMFAAAGLPAPRRNGLTVDESASSPVGDLRELLVDILHELRNIRWVLER